MRSMLVLVLEAIMHGLQYVAYAVVNDAARRKVNSRSVRRKSGARRAASRRDATFLIDAMMDITLALHLGQSHKKQYWKPTHSHK